MHHDYPKQEFHYGHTSRGAFGHVMRTAGLLTPLIIGECVKDADKRWRDTRITIDSASKETGQIVTAINVRRKYHQIGTRVYLTVIKSSETETSVRVALSE